MSLENSTGSYRSRAGGNGRLGDVVVVLGDVVDSRAHTDQVALLQRLGRLLDWVATTAPVVQAPHPTIGDEFQGVYPTVETALRAVLMLQLACLADPGDPGLEIRAGLGRGEVIQSDVADAPFGQSGDAWWAAREALGGLTPRALWPKSRRIAYRAARGDGAMVDAYLMCRDEVLSRMDRTDARIALGIASGERQSDIAASLGISQPAVARRARDHGVLAVIRSDALLFPAPT